MSSKFKDISMKNHTFCYFDDIINKKSLIQIILKWMKSIQKYTYLLYWICNDQRFEI